jgi:hypothetical protein
MQVRVRTQSLPRSYPRTPRAATAGWAPPLLDCPRVLPFAICMRAHGAAMRSALSLPRRLLFPRTSRKAVAIAAFDWMCMAPQRF